MGILLFFVLIIYEHRDVPHINFLFLTVRRKARSGIGIPVHSKGFNYGIIYASSCTQSIFDP